MTLKVYNPNRYLCSIVCFNLCYLGHVGCGKGSLLHAILKELPALSGGVTVNGSVAYTSQEPWVIA